MADSGSPPPEPAAADVVREQPEVPEHADITEQADIPEQAALLASEASEAESPLQRRRLAERFASAMRAAGGSIPVTATRDAALSAARATGRGVRATRRSLRAARRGVGGNWLVTHVMAMAPRLRVRDQAALRTQFPGKSAEEIADTLVEGAARASAAVGGAVGAWAALPALPAFPAEVATETLALVGIEIKLVAELHEAYGVPAPGNAVDRMTAYVAAWAHRRGVAMVPGGIILAPQLARRLRWRLAGRAGRTAFSLAPLLTGAAAGALLNRRETRRLGEDVRADLRHYTRS